MTVAESPRAAEMRTKAAKLYNLQEKSAVPQKEYIPLESFASQSGVGITLKFLKDMGTSLDTGVPDIDAETTLWQINWAQVLEPPLGTQLRTQDTPTRLWFPVRARDFHDSMILYMTEAAALKCSRHADAASFEEAHRAGRLAFPVVAAIKIL